MANENGITRVSIPALEEAIRNFEVKKNNLEIAYLKISNAVRELGSTWKGASSEKFEAQFDEMYQNLKQTEERMDGAIQKLRTAMETYQEVENQNKAAADAVATGDTNYF